MGEGKLKTPHNLLLDLVIYFELILLESFKLSANFQSSPKTDFDNFLQCFH